MELALRRQALDGLHRTAVRLNGEDGTALDRLAVEQHGAGTAAGGVTADVSAR